MGALGGNLTPKDDLSRLYMQQQLESADNTVPKGDFITLSAKDNWDLHACPLSASGVDATAMAAMAPAGMAGHAVLPAFTLVALPKPCRLCPVENSLRYGGCPRTSHISEAAKRP